MGLLPRRSRPDGTSEDIQRQLSALTDKVETLRADAAGHAAWLNDLQKWMTSCVQALSTLTDAPPIQSPDLQLTGPSGRRRDDIEAIRSELAIRMVTTWVDQVHVPPDLLVSVITPTSNRRAQLEQAIESVRAQSYPMWELIVMDNASTDGTADLLRDIAEKDQRVKAVLSEHRSSPTSRRNTALAMAKGQVITYLDDDNLMQSCWLKAVAWAFFSWPETQLLYGARIIEEAPTTVGAVSLPGIEFFPWDRRRYEHSCYVDQNVVAHRAHLPEAHFDEQLDTLQDWDFWLRLTAQMEPLALPVVACLYHNRGFGRLSQQRPLDAGRTIRARAHMGRPLRLLADANSVPPGSQGDVERDLAALAGEGALVATTSDLAAGVSDHDPDLIVVYGTDDVRQAMSRIEDAHRPFALRTLSPLDADQAAQLTGHHLCIGAWPESGDQHNTVEELAEALRCWKLVRS